MYTLPSVLQLAVLAATSLLISPTTAQTYSSCNPLLQSGCPSDAALGKSVNVDFTSGPSSSFTPHGAPTYGSNGAAFTVAQSGDSPLIQSNFYIMFGHVEYVVRAAPGTGIVSSAVLQSDCLDEIDWEWLGGDDQQVQTNYFGKGITTTYNRGAYSAASNNHDQFRTYSVDWTADQIVWQIDGVTVRVLTQEAAAAGQYPQTPMMVKVGAWAGGDPSNAEGTVEWAGGLVDYSNGPFTMYLKSISVNDYSTGTSYSYSGTGGTWQSIVSEGGKISSTGNDTPATTASSPKITSATSNDAPVGGFGLRTTSTYVTPSIWPWVTTGAASLITQTNPTVVTSISGLPSGWTINSSGRVVPPSSSSMTNVPIYLLLCSLGAGILLGLR